MNIYATEEEQIAKIKEWLRNYGFTILLGIVLAIGLSYGYRYWVGHTEKLYEQASVGYENMMSNLIAKNTDKATLQAQYLIKRFPNTGYAQSAALVLAQIAADNNQLDEAAKQLKQIASNAKNSGIRQLATIRYARILSAQNKNQDALNELEAVKDKAFTAAVEMIKGDIYTKLNQVDKAKQSYALALSALGNVNIDNRLLQMKIDNLSKAEISTANQQIGEKA